MKGENPPNSTTDGSLDRAELPDLTHPETLLSLLEPDQMVAAKEHAQFGRRHLSLRMRILLWALRVYLVVMLVLVVLAAIRVIHTAP